MYLIHTNFGESEILKILQDGKLKSSSKTKNIKLTGINGSKYIYLRLGKHNDYGNFYFNSELLLKNKFYLQTGWKYNPVSTKYDGTKLTKDKLKEILTKFNNNVNKYIKENKDNIGFMIQMSNEILLEKEVILKEYLKKINISKYDQDIVSYVNKNYPNVVINYPSS